MLADLLEKVEKPDRFDDDNLIDSLTHPEIELLKIILKYMDLGKQIVLMDGEALRNYLRKMDIRTGELKDDFDAVILHSPYPVELKSIDPEFNNKFNRYLVSVAKKEIE